MRSIKSNISCNIILPENVCYFEWGSHRKYEYHKNKISDDNHLVKNCGSFKRARSAHHVRCVVEFLEKKSVATIITDLLFKIHFYSKYTRIQQNYRKIAELTVR